MALWLWVVVWQLRSRALPHTFAVGLTELNYDLGKIDDPKNLSSAKVFLYSGELDTVVHRPVMQGLQEYYAALVSSTKGGNITTQFDILSGGFDWVMLLGW